MPPPLPSGSATCCRVEQPQLLSTGAAWALALVALILLAAAAAVAITQPGAVQQVLQWHVNTARHQPAELISNCSLVSDTALLDGLTGLDQMWIPLPGADVNGKQHTLTACKCFGLHAASASSLAATVAWNIEGLDFLVNPASPVSHQLLHPQYHPKQSTPLLAKATFLAASAGLAPQEQQQLWALAQLQLFGFDQLAAQSLCERLLEHDAACALCKWCLALAVGPQPNKIAAAQHQDFPHFGAEDADAAEQHAAAALQLAVAKMQHARSSSEVRSLVTPWHCWHCEGPVIRPHTGMNPFFAAPVLPR
jgi:hypothetical protein